MAGVAMAESWMKRVQMCRQKGSLRGERSSHRIWSKAMICMHASNHFECIVFRLVIPSQYLPHTTQRAWRGRRAPIAACAAVCPARDGGEAGGRRAPELLAPRIPRADGGCHGESLYAVPTLTLTVQSFSICELVANRKGLHCQS